MQNDEGQNMDLYIPRKCCATNRLITSKDHASVQINLGHLDERGVYTGAFTTFALCGFIRAQGDAADSAPLAEEESRGPPTIGCYVIVSICNLVSSFNLQFFYFLH